MKEDRAIGIIPVYQSEDGKTLFCIVREGDGHWGFPKGHQELGETDEQTARRELEEETGIKHVEVDPNQTFAEEYTFLRDGGKYHKIVKYVLGRVQSTENATAESFKSEIPEVRWLSYEEAKEVLTFGEAKKMLDFAFEYISQT